MMIVEEREATSTKTSCVPRSSRLQRKVRLQRRNSRTTYQTGDLSMNLLHRYNHSSLAGMNTTKYYQCRSSQPFRQGQRVSREQNELLAMQQQEEENRRMKQLMVRICQHLELKHKHDLEKLLYAQDQNIHYEIDVEQAI
ncbi:hypothetical protein FGO68_gene13453 [Halteria grandinella]|uniref:Uncharacterized protein n=1 Tax=Halteria grandinella TaxID=5974 RepID=A0A8J8P256_HALGN|nr:hypothetical protein FGO68_gene13453 [Halteria grandinella]